MFDECLFSGLISSTRQTPTPYSLLLMLILFTILTNTSSLLHAFCDDAMALMASKGTKLEKLRSVALKGN